MNKKHFHKRFLETYLGPVYEGGPFFYNKLFSSELVCNAFKLGSDELESLISAFNSAHYMEFRLNGACIEVDNFGDVRICLPKEKKLFGKQLATLKEIAKIKASFMYFLTGQLDAQLPSISKMRALSNCPSEKKKVIATYGQVECSIQPDHQIMASILNYRKYLFENDACLLYSALEELYNPIVITYGSIQEFSSDTFNIPTDRFIDELIKYHDPIDTIVKSYEEPETCYSEPRIEISLEAQDNKNIVQEFELAMRPALISIALFLEDPDDVILENLQKPQNILEDIFKQ